MLKYNIRTVEAEIEKIAFSKMEIVQQAEKLGLLYNARECLLNLLSTNTGKYADTSKKEQINGNTSITDELNDILPALKEYQQAKTEFIQHRITQEGVNHSLQRLVVEINEFITVLYSNTTAPEEREILKNIKTFEN